MTNKFEVHIDKHPHYVKFKNSDYYLAIIQFDIVQDGIPFDNGYRGRYECSDKGLKKLLGALNSFLAGKATKNGCISFEIPYVIGGFVRYQYYFDAVTEENLEDSYWMFRITPNFSAEIRQVEYEYRLDYEQLKALRNSLASQINRFDWENCGKTEYFRFELPERSYEWCYSAKGLEDRLNRTFTGDRLSTIYVSGLNYADPLRVEDNFVNYYLGSQVYLEFENKHADILACAQGLFKLRVFDNSEVKMIRFFDQMEDPDDVLCDTGDVFSISYSGCLLQKVRVESTEYWPWAPAKFDKSKLSDPVELPSSLHFDLDNHKTLTIAGWDDDFIIGMELMDARKQEMIEG